MKLSGFSLKEAEQLHASHQHLIGQRYSSTSNAIIDCIAIAPFDQHNKDRFKMLYLLFEDAKMALEHEYKGSLYDVLIVARNEEIDETLFIELNKWDGMEGTANEHIVARPVRENIL